MKTTQVFIVMLAVAAFAVTPAMSQRPGHGGGRPGGGAPMSSGTHGGGHSSYGGGHSSYGGGRPSSSFGGGHSSSPRPSSYGTHTPSSSRPTSTYGGRPASTSVGHAPAKGGRGPAPATMRPSSTYGGHSAGAHSPAKRPSAATTRPGYAPSGHSHAAQYGGRPAGGHRHGGSYSAPGPRHHHGGPAYGRAGRPGPMPPAHRHIRPAPYFYHPIHHHHVHMHPIFWDPVPFHVHYWPGFWGYCHGYWHDYAVSDIVVVRQYVRENYNTDLITYVMSDNYMYALTKSDGDTFLQVFDKDDNLLAQQKVSDKYCIMELDKENGGCWIMKNKNKDPLLFLYNDGELLIYEED